MKIQRRIKVSINWLRPEEGGRTRIIGGYHYRPTIIIPKDDDDKHWTFGIDFYSLAEYDQPTIAEGVFIAKFSEDAPWGVMSLGTEFWVMEGSRKVGYGTVVEECRDIDVSGLPTYKDKF